MDGPWKHICYVKQAIHKRPYGVSFRLHEMPRASKYMETESRSVVARGWGRGKWEVLNSHGFLFVVMKMPWTWIVVMVSQLSEYTKNHRVLHLKWWNVWYANYLPPYKQQQQNPATWLSLLWAPCGGHMYVGAGQSERPVHPHLSRS